MRQDFRAVSTMISFERGVGFRAARGRRRHYDAFDALTATFRFSAARFTRFRMISPRGLRDDGFIRLAFLYALFSIDCGDLRYKRRARQIISAAFLRLQFHGLIISRSRGHHHFFHG